MVALRIEERPLGRPHLAMTEIERQVAANDHAASRAIPSARLAATEPTPAMAMTPSAMQQALLRTDRKSAHVEI